MAWSVLRIRIQLLLKNMYPDQCTFNDKKYFFTYFQRKFPVYFIILLIWLGPDLDLQHWVWYEYRTLQCCGRREIGWIKTNNCTCTLCFRCRNYSTRIRRLSLILTSVPDPHHLFKHAVQNKLWIRIRIWIRTVWSDGDLDPTKSLDPFRIGFTTLFSI